MLFRGGKQGNGVRSVRTAFEILEVLAASEEALGVTEIARSLGITKTRGYRHLRTLVGTGYAIQDAPTEKYRAGIKLFLLGQRVAARHSFLSAARKVMRPLRDAVGHTVTVSHLEEGAVVVLDMVRGSSPFEIGTKPGSRFPLDRSAQGKIALAFGNGLETRPGARLRREIHRSRERGWAVAPEEILRGVNALAAPIFFADGSLAGTIALVDSVELLPAEPSRKQIKAILVAAGRASAELGYHRRAR